MFTLMVYCLVVKFLVQNCITHKYLRLPDQWTPDANEAENFESSEHAMAHCVRNNIPAVQIVLKFESERYDVKLPITRECEDGQNGHVPAAF